MEQLFRGTSADRQTDRQAHLEASPGAGLHAPCASALAGHSRLESSSGGKQPGMRLGKELHARQQQAPPATAVKGTLGYVRKSEISLALKTLLSTSVFCGFVNHILYMAQM